MDLTRGRFTDLPEEVVRGDFRLSPPKVKRLTAEASPDGGTLFRARLAPDSRLTRVLKVSGPKASITFRDDGTGGDDKPGDGRYAAILPVPFSKISDGQSRILAALRNRKIVDMPVFEGRQLVGHRALKDFSDVVGQFELIPPGVFGMLLNTSRTLLITDPGVIGDPTRTFDPCGGSGSGTPNGVWTFSHLMTEIANQPLTGLDPETMARDWVNAWAATLFLDHSIWRPEVDLAHAPFKLVAIVNRPDLATNLSGYGGASSGSGGEGRFVFQVCSGPPRMLILEYGVPISTCGAIRDWAREWVALNSMTPGTAAYNAALEALTETFVRRGAEPAKPNGSALNQARTDAFVTSGHSGSTEFENWLLHEWQIQAPNEGPTQSTVAQTPDDGFNRTSDLASWINLKEGAILNGIHIVEEFFTPFDPTRRFLGNSSQTNITTIDDVTTQTHWRAPGIASNDARQLFSLATCSGCHTGETGTDFRHLGLNIPPSGFLTGISVPDPVSPSTMRHFDDLRRRAIVLSELASGFCLPKVPDMLTELPPFDPGIQQLGGVLPPLPALRFTPTIASH